MHLLSCVNTLNQLTEIAPLSYFLMNYLGWTHKRVDSLRPLNTFGTLGGATNNRLKLIVCGSATTWMRENVLSDFIRQYTAFGKTERGTIYQLTDLFTLFHLRYVKGYRGQDENHWQNMIDSPSRRAWSGYSFEQLSLHHIRQIKKKLGISGVQSDICGWKGDGAQIDLLIDRRDQTINLCEMKFSQGEYEITKQYDERLRERAEIFRSVTKTRKAIHQTLVSYKLHIDTIFVYLHTFCL